MRRKNGKSDKVKLPQDMLVAKQNLIKAIDNGFNFSFKNDDDRTVDCITLFALLSWLVEYRPLLTSHEYTVNAFDVSCVLVKRLHDELGLTLEDNFVLQTLPTVSEKRIRDKAFDYDKVLGWASTLMMFAARFKFPVCSPEVLARLFAAYFELMTLQVFGGNAFDMYLLEIFTEKSVTSCVNFMNACMEGENYKDAQRYLVSGVFAVMKVGEGRPRHLTKEGRQFMRLAAVLLYKIYSQYESLQYGKMFKKVDLRMLMQMAGVGRVDWMSDYLSGVFTESDNRFVALCALNCEPNGYTIKVSEKKIEEYARVSRLYHSIQLMTYAILLYLEGNIDHTYVRLYYKDALAAEVKKATVDSSRKSEEIAKLSAELKERKNEIRSINKQLESLSIECSTLVNTNASLEARLAEATAVETLKSKDELINSLQNTIYEYEQEAQTFASKLESARLRIKTLEDKGTAYEDNAIELERYKNKVRDLEDALDSFTKEEMGVSFDEVSNFCRGVRPFIISGLKGLDTSLSKVFKDYVHYDINDGSAEITVPTNIDCVLVYTRVMGHRYTESVRSKMPAGIPYIPINNSNPDLIRKAVYMAFKSKE